MPLLLATELSKWPYRLVPYPAQMFYEEGFYSFSYNRPHSIWHALAVAGLSAVTIGCCLFPIFPIRAKLCVLYLCLTFLTPIIGFCAVLAGVSCHMDASWQAFVGVSLTLTSLRRTQLYWRRSSRFSGTSSAAMVASRGAKTTTTTTSSLTTKTTTTTMWTRRPRWPLMLMLATIVALVLVLRYYGPTEAQRTALRGRMNDLLQRWFEWNPLQLAGKGEGEGGVEDILHRRSCDDASNSSARAIYQAEYRDDADMDVDGDDADVNIVETEDDADRADL